MTAREVVATRRYRTQLGRLVDGLSGVLASLWLDLGSYDRDDIPRWEERTEEPIRITGEQAAAAAVSYMTLILESPIPDFRTPPVIADTEMPFLRMWRGLNDGQRWEDARQTVAEAIGEVSNDVVHSTARRASDEAATEQVVGWRRVLVGASCEWCALVSTQRYRSAESADFGHTRCDCQVVPITGESDPGRVINSELLKSLKAEGVSDRITRNRQARRSLQAADNAEARRDSVLNELLTETDPARRRRLEDRARRWQNEAEAFRARAAEEAARPVKPRLDGSTGYVTPEGAPTSRP